MSSVHIRKCGAKQRLPTYREIRKCHRLYLAVKKRLAYYERKEKQMIDEVDGDKDVILKELELEIRQTRKDEALFSARRKIHRLEEERDEMNEVIDKFAKLYAGQPVVAEAAKAPTRSSTIRPQIDAHVSRVCQELGKKESEVEEEIVAFLKSKLPERSILKAKKRLPPPRAVYKEFDFPICEEEKLNLLSSWLNTKTFVRK
ncbi:uncharacterized protein LOC118461164 [Anopheles albimanus]|uniref:uncharacterized protein LOC118461164 n=1 Tax=Anopheles albimanus TaxID=7167 RepID=UPI001641315F|nr:uncharacterized protein LOC118461164 [Anopheles albimanus]